MPTSTQQQWTSQNSSSSNKEWGRQQLTAADQTGPEKWMQSLAQQIYGSVVSDLGTGYGVSYEDALNPKLTPEMQALAQQAQQASLNTSRAGMAGQFDENMSGIANQMAARGITNSSAFGSASGMMTRDMQRQYNLAAMRAQETSANQMVGMAQNRQQASMQLLGMKQNMQQWAANPQMLRDLMEYRLRTGSVDTSGGSDMTSSSSGYSKSKTTTPTDWGAILGGLGSVLGGGGITGLLGGLGGLGGGAPAGMSATPFLKQEPTGWARQAPSAPNLSGMAPSTPTLDRYGVRY